LSLAKSATASNTFDPEVVNALLGKIDGYDSDLLSERGSYMQKCRNIRESIQGVYDQAKAAGVPKKELSILVKIRKNEKKNVALYNDLEADQQAIVAMLAATEKVADLPLWRSAADRKPVPGVDVVRTGQHPDPMFDDSDPQGIKHASGIKPLN
jgi:hypothetical protein